MFWVPNRKTKEQIDREKAKGGKEKVAVRG